MDRSQLIHPPMPRGAALATERRTNSANPVQLLFRKLISTAIEDSRKRRPDGSLTDAALQAQDWLAVKLDWTTIPLERRLAAWNQPGPPMALRELREAFALSFSFCCRQLGLNEEKVRQHGLPKLVARVHTGGRHKVTFRIAFGRQNLRR
jgi:hypothetical protein